MQFRTVLNHVLYLQRRHLTFEVRVRSLLVLVVQPTHEHDRDVGLALERELTFTRYYAS